MNPINQSPQQGIKRSASEQAQPEENKRARSQDFFTSLQTLISMINPYQECERELIARQFAEMPIEELHELSQEERDDAFAILIGTACIHGLWDFIDRMLDENYEININHNYSVESPVPKTLLSMLVRAKQWDLIQKILMKYPQADLNTPFNEKGITVLWMLANLNQWDLVGYIIERFPNANFNAMPSAGYYQNLNVLQLLCRFTQWELLDKIVKGYSRLDFNSAPVTGVDAGKTVLWHIAANQQWELFKNILDTNSFLDFNASPKNGSEEGQTVIWIAARCNQWKFVHKIVGMDHTFSIDINKAPKEGPHQGKSLLWLISDRGKQSLVNKILTNYPNADVNAKDKNNQSVLWLNAWDQYFNESTPETELILKRFPEADVTVAAEDEEIGKGGKKYNIFSHTTMADEHSQSAYCIIRGSSFADFYYKHNKTFAEKLETTLYQSTAKAVSVLFNQELQLPDEIKVKLANHAYTHEADVEELLEYPVCHLNSWMNFHVMQYRENLLNRQLETIAKLSFQRFRWQRNMLRQHYNKAQITDTWAMITNVAKQFMQKNDTLYFDSDLRSHIYQEVGKLQVLSYLDVYGAFERAVSTYQKSHRAHESDLHMPNDFDWQIGTDAFQAYRWSHDMSSIRYDISDIVNMIATTHANYPYLITSRQRERFNEQVKHTDIITEEKIREFILDTDFNAAADITQRMKCINEPSEDDWEIGTEACQVYRWSREVNTLSCDTNDIIKMIAATHAKFPYLTTLKHKQQFIQQVRDTTVITQKKIEDFILNTLYK